jgi:hypothetical protein
LDQLIPIFVVIAALALITQAFVLVAFYFTFKRLSTQVERFMKEMREIMGPIKTITGNLTIASANFVEIGATFREQFRRIESMVVDTGDVLRLQLERMDRMTRDIADRVNETAAIVQDSVIRPVREMAAIAKGVGRGFESLFFRKRRSTVDQARQDEELFI